MNKEIKVLLLNSAYEPLSGISLRKALKHISKNRVDILCSDSSVQIRSGALIIDLPTVIKLNNNGDFVGSRKYEPRYNKKGVFKRDDYTCAYCGQYFKEKDLSIDHIVPRSKGGINSWTNCITACKKCNSYKADFSIEETKMYLRFKPYIPYNAVLLNCKAYLNHPDWMKYITPEMLRTCRRH